MFVPIPFRARFRAERFPYVTISLIVLNVLIFAFTCDPQSWQLEVREGAVNALGMPFAHFSVFRLFSSMFLHGNLEHVVVNMIFLWAFGPTVEGRLGHAKYLGLYLLSGIGAGLLHLVTVGAIRPNIPYLGASGAIMGVAGAFLYAFPYTAIEMFFWPLFRFFFFQMRAWWLLLIFIGLDVLNGVFSAGGDGVAHFAHLGGAATGYFLAMALRVERVPEEVADAEAITDEFAGDYERIALDDLLTLVDQRADDAQLGLVLCRRLANDYGPNRVQECVAHLHHFSRALAERGDPVPLAQLMVSLPPQAGVLPPLLLMRVAAKLELKIPGLAAPLYRRVYDQAPDSPDAEGALMRLAAMAERAGDQEGAVSYYREIVKRYPRGTQILHATNALQRLEQPTIGFSPGTRPQQKPGTPRPR